MNANPKLALIRDPAYLCSHRDRECLAGPGISGGVLVRTLQPFNLECEGEHRWLIYAGSV